MVTFIVVLSVAILYMGITTWGLKTKFTIAEREGVRYHHVNGTHKLLEYGTFCFFIIMIILSKGQNVMDWILVYLIFLYAIRTFMEWKYEREQQRFLLSLNIFMACLLYLTLASVSILIY
ncbi:DUF4181 domain-containing protein [Virgibacillus halodenitrificans]|uniref:DUF4181 domain-containing protein n=1 Tax=Virgibacillus halodenitrificans TaxID=1482 RepID=UPI0024C011B3|nr:DUF4181 domain-containing protein [Virgibacillus halodenitrificans]WHX27971.1 DUF4181 domain-containing protein [Virgibacillus halodenitrificans]